VFVSVVHATAHLALLASDVLPNEGVLPVRWLSPEVLRQGVYSHASDVWAYGVVLWEIFSCGKTPFGVYACVVRVGLLYPNRGRFIFRQALALATRKCCRLF
jgi:serine/threonine protein kinase